MEDELEQALQVVDAGLAAFNGNRAQHIELQTAYATVTRFAKMGLVHDQMPKEPTAPSAKEPPTAGPDAPGNDVPPAEDGSSTEQVPGTPEHQE